MSKEELRNIILTKLRTQTEEQREQKSRLIEGKVLKLEEFVKAKRVMFYLTFDGEVKTESMISMARELGKEICVPLCDTKEKALKPCILMKDSKLEEGPYRILQPQDKIDLPIDKLDLVFVPALAFDKCGNRLGRGKGYYDRFLKRVSHHTHTIGLAFDFQVLPSVPVEQNDVQVEKVLSA